MSFRSGNGKSTYIQQSVENIFKENKNPFNYEVLRIKSFKVNIDKEIEKFMKFKMEASKSKKNNLPTIYHIDIAYEVFQNVDQYLFNLIVCSYLKHTNGLVWRRSPSNDIYLIEMTPPYFNLEISRKLNSINNQTFTNKLVSLHSMLNYLPSIEFRTPQKYYYDIINDSTNESKRKDILFSDIYKEFKYQRTAYYLKLTKEVKENRLKNASSKLGNNSLVTYNPTNDDKLKDAYDPNLTLNEFECLNVILNNSGLQDPNWHELSNYSSFLNSQIEMAETSNMLSIIKGLKSVCVQLIINMANGMSFIFTFILTIDLN